MTPMSYQYATKKFSNFCGHIKICKQWTWLLNLIYVFFVLLCFKTRFNLPFSAYDNACSKSGIWQMEKGYSCTGFPYPHIRGKDVEGLLTNNGLKVEYVYKVSEAPGMSIFFYVVNRLKMRKQKCQVRLNNNYIWQ